MNSKIDVLISREEIEKKVRELGEKITTDYKGKENVFKKHVIW